MFFLLQRSAKPKTRQVCYCQTVLQKHLLLYFFLEKIKMSNFIKLKIFKVLFLHVKFKIDWRI